jgi:hypothetical protein
MTHQSSSGRSRRSAWKAAPVIINTATLRTEPVTPVSLPELCPGCDQEAARLYELKSLSGRLSAHNAVCAPCLRAALGIHR